MDVLPSNCYVFYPKVLLLTAMKKGNMSKMKALLEDSDPELDINSMDQVSQQCLLPLIHIICNQHIVHVIVAITLADQCVNVVVDNVICCTYREIRKYV